MDISSPVYRLDKGYVVFTPNDLPRTAHGKINRNELIETANNLING